ncbi:YrdC domain-containing protein-like protein [Leptotrombidium deliense]|uniref:Threonylcarbamoyl-AMP synthase n=1 Tax=Leptotrombidium deliense TaxID=299467 RepID=A0A443S6H7_9ACAR|nr:YrdC domain-containing protein-like protein [Leptotrombidium deliense]
MRIFRHAMNSVVSVFVNTCENGRRAVSDAAVLLAHSLIMNGGVVAVPTDTIYGLAALAQLSEAVDRMYDIKGRDAIKPIAICVGDVEEIRKWCRVTVSEQLLHDLLPGPVTLVFERLPVVNSRLNPNTDLLGIRIPKNDFIRSVCRMCDSALALTSANISSEKSCLSVNEFKHLWPHLNAVFDGGLLTEDTDRLGSTVVDLSRIGYYRIIREGCAFKKIKHLLEDKYLLKKVSQ